MRESQWSDRLVAYLAFRRTPGALARLDGLRALAILLVLARHGARPFSDGNTLLLPIGLWEAASPLLNGWIGVDLFFVLSGFLICYHLLRRWQPGNGWEQWRRYLGRRLLRIVPAYYAFLLFVVTVGMPAYELSRENLGWRTVYHLLFLQDYLKSDIVVAFWSLGVEEKFYLLAPLLIVPLLRARPPVVGWTLASLAALPLLARWLTYSLGYGRGSYLDYFQVLRSPFHVSAEGLVVGCWCAFLYRDWQAGGGGWLRRPRMAGWLRTAGVLAVGGPWLLAPLSEHQGAANAVLLGTVLALGFGALMLGLLIDEAAWPWLRSRGWLFWSKLSYCLYLVHMTVIELAQSWLDAWWVMDHWSPAAQMVAFMPLYLALSVAVALVLHYLVEKPFLLLKARL